MPAIKFYIAFLLLTTLTSCALAQQLAIKNPLRFLALGDSYTIGQGVSAEESWPIQLVKALENKGVTTGELKIIARTGWRTDNLMVAIAEEKPDSSYNLVSLLIGVNNQYQGRNIKEYPDDFRKLLQTAIALCNGNREGVFVLSIPDYGYTPFGLPYINQISTGINAYNTINREISEELGVVYFDITPITRQGLAIPEYIASDQLHPSGEMYAKWVELIINGSQIIDGISNTSEFRPPGNSKVYPNPAIENITIATPQGLSTIEIYNNTGELIWQSGYSSAKGNMNINISAWAKGLYFFRIKQKSTTVSSGKFVKM